VAASAAAAASRGSCAEAVGGDETSPDRAAWSASARASPAVAPVCAAPDGLSSTGPPFGGGTRGVGGGGSGGGGRGAGGGGTVCGLPGAGPLSNRARQKWLLKAPSSQPPASTILPSGPSAIASASS